METGSLQLAALNRAKAVAGRRSIT